MRPERGELPESPLAPELTVLIRGLDEAYEKKAWHGYLMIMSGIAAHDVYHAGQIQLLKRLQAEA